MREHDSAAEAPFFERFDCCFPYDDRKAASGLIREGFQISLNGAFGVLEEICHPPPLERIPSSLLLELLNEWCEVRGLDFHPLAEPVSQIAATVIRGLHAPIEECIGLAEVIGQYPAQRAALKIAGMALDPDDEESQRRLNHVESEIRERWDRMAV